MGPNHTERLADGLDVVEPGRTGYRQLLGATDATARPRISWPVFAGAVVLVVVNVGALLALLGGVAR